MPKAGRAYCPRCQYPLRTCVCSGIAPVSTTMNVRILQDPKENEHAKNTARLLQLLVANCSISVGEFPIDFDSVIAELHNLGPRYQDKVLVLFPSENAVSLREVCQSSADLSYVIVLDGTWRKAKRLWLNNPWLHNLQSVALSEEDSGVFYDVDYHIRKKPFAHSLSTLMATAITLNALDGVSTTPFSNALNALQSHWPCKSRSQQSISVLTI
ncbi:tRNA-uridine aminocarboxypropyltransferase [Ningiella sp. W23]|uniref:tRNA-uridine aminocarboxypropyltransferase n=1 Tax=Ningiella sp. W23 TaxID=3023715 RepID=UPI003757A130